MRMICIWIWFDNFTLSHLHVRKHTNIQFFFSLSSKQHSDNIARNFLSTVSRYNKQLTKRMLLIRHTDTTVTPSTWVCTRVLLWAHTNKHKHIHICMQSCARFYFNFFFFLLLSSLCTWLFFHFFCMLFIFHDVVCLFVHDMDAVLCVFFVSIDDKSVNWECRAHVPCRIGFLFLLFQCSWIRMDDLP